ncbi:uncharacterized protein LOC133904033 [Phragmites australis]|uniref:uncharacterized protein LOC133904033 n=1 Tax=Phragmites australis TaxID=29695 RepID=UPI002D783CC7|nr:uncharacterized protein LOC133904033 [Phragmites australis]
MSVLVPIDQRASRFGLATPGPQHNHAHQPNQHLSSSRPLARKPTASLHAHERLVVQRDVPLPSPTHGQRARRRAPLAPLTSRTPFRSARFGGPGRKGGNAAGLHIYQRRARQPPPLRTVQVKNLKTGIFCLSSCLAHIIRTPLYQSMRTNLKFRYKATEKGRKVVMIILYGKEVPWPMGAGLVPRPCATGGLKWGTGFARDNMGAMSLHVA